MGRHAPQVYTLAADIARIEGLVTQLPSDAHVCIVLRDGARYSGVVSERPALQLFEDAHGVEGMNAQVRLDDPAAPTWTRYLWLGDVARVESLPSR